MNYYRFAYRKLHGKHVNFPHFPTHKNGQKQTDNKKGNKNGLVSIN
jgi:hypothetical protein